MPSRRKLLIGAAAGAGILAVGATGGTVFALTRTPSRALEPWADPGTLVSDPRVKALEWAVLVPNPHNRQPWLVELVDDDSARLYCDLDRRLPMTDPYDRQITIGLGCFLEMYRLAAADLGFRAEITPFPDGAPDPAARLNQRPVAAIRLVPETGLGEPLFAAAPHRRTTKEPYEPTPVDPDHVAALDAAVRSTRFEATREPARVARLADLALRAWQVEADTPRTFQESIDLMRIGRGEIEANPDGIDLGGPFLETLSLLGLLTREELADPTSMAAQTGNDMYREMINSAQGFVWLVTDTNGRAEQLAAGRDWLRMNLAATLAGLAIQPLSQALQEFDEMQPLAAELNERLGVAAPERVQMFARIGYGPEVPPSPRWPASTRLI